MPSGPSSVIASPETGAAAKLAAANDASHDAFTTLRLPKGQVNGQNASRSSDTPGSSTSTDPFTMPRSSSARLPLPSSQALHDIGLVDYLDQDTRPAFVVDLFDSSDAEPGPLRLVYLNPSLRAARELVDQLSADTSDPDHSADSARFKAWAIAGTSMWDSPDALPLSLEYGGIAWTASTVKKRFRVVSGNTNLPPIAPASSNFTPRTQEVEQQERPANAQDSDYFGVDGPAPRHEARTPDVTPDVAMEDIVTPGVEELSISSSPPEPQTTFDWTRIPADDPCLSDHHRFARSVDWASTSLGPVGHWPADLRIMSNLIMGSPHPSAMYWGPDHIAIYNEAYIALASQKHPKLMGTAYREAWPEIWDRIQPVLKRAWHNGDAVMRNDDQLFMTRNGFLEETYFNWALIPLVGGDGSVVAIYNPAFENTRRNINERRMAMLHEVGVQTAMAGDVKEFWEHVLKGLETNEFDVPFALLYSVDDGGDSDLSSMHSGGVWNPPQIVLEGSIGVPPGHPAAVPAIDLRSSDAGFASYMRDSMTSPTEPIVLTEEDGTLPEHLLDGLEWKGFRDKPRTIVVFPVNPMSPSDAVVGFVVLAANPRRPYDKDYQLFISLLSRQLATSMASVVLFEDEIKRGQRAARLAARNHEQLSIELHLRTQQAVESEYRFTRMAELGPVGMFIADDKGSITYCNEMWYKVSGHERGTTTLDAWMQSIKEEDLPGVEDVWRRLVQDKTAIATHEFRFKGVHNRIEGHLVDTWALMSAYPETTADGHLKSIFGCITDISQQKWAEDFQKQRREAAVELKRQQENFIDITSHEMRNPLSAILQCADEISACLYRYRMGETGEHDPNALGVLIDSCVEAANTISLCASHQKRIVDDILTLSKLDSNLLLVTPVDVQPVAVLQNVLKMFEAELAAEDIKGQFHIDQAYHKLGVDWAKLDPSRLRQVLINLMTNAIKFTQGRPKRCITISVGASKDVEIEGLSYVPTRHPSPKDITDEPDWGHGEKLNLHVAVTDTGPGLDDGEKDVLFQRFSQVSPRTHVQYGGSGLGLFICRILTEMQGGRIGVHSKKGEGSTFAFHIKIRKSEAPPVLSTSPSPRSTTPAGKLPGDPSRPNTLHGAAPKLLSAAGSGRKMDVLIVEDNLVNQKVLNRGLKLSGHNTYLANHGLEALEALRQSRFWDASEDTAKSNISMDASEVTAKNNISIILMDIEMPEMDGITCTREIRRLEREGAITKHIPIIAATAYARPEQIADAKAAGMDGVISKPFQVHELLPKMEELVDKYGMT
ncbi:hypothetical protein B0T18DRAFT_437960 [Schizothecium vesticola]|uniref:Histidine kinase n=1 Tax=Schizothecium vesticola TaxID=314040 RepID=A0AA40K4P0_9PEZI|nr:hypothetical protein B0T18DRAFT_437960 [Schizothecium vesticola]